MSVNVAGLRELSGAVSAFVGSGLAHCVVLFNVLLQFRECREAVRADRTGVGF